MTNKVEIRTATIDDAEQILDVQKAAYWKQGEIYQNFRIRPLIQTLDSLKDDLKSKHFLVAIIDGQLVGSVRFWEKDGIVEVERIAIQPEFQNQGIGSKLLEEVEKHCEDARSFQLFTGIKSIRNIHVYEKLGYRIIETKEDGQGILTHYMRKEI